MTVAPGENCGRSESKVRDDALAVVRGEQRAPRGSADRATGVPPQSDDPDIGNGLPHPPDGDAAWGSEQASQLEPDGNVLLELHVVEARHVGVATAARVGVHEGRETRTVRCARAGREGAGRSSAVMSDPLGRDGRRQRVGDLLEGLAHLLLVVLSDVGDDRDVVTGP